ncbi:Dystroglycan [Sarcoptes scabiei]|uniref:Dystroglycan n=1 Tax=Sarcoptes scabiei TaxID=52283 RepID=A0A834R8M1_SARSC|nr:Dystroglycan [Sarcoptes scabiei]
MIPQAKACSLHYIWQHLIILISLFTSSIVSFEDVENVFGIFSIPDQQAFIGKLFYYQIEIPENVHNFTLIQAGLSNDDLDHQNDHHHQHQHRLPDWLYFDSKEGLLFGVPNEKRIYFFQVEAFLDNHQRFGDIFIIESIDSPDYLLNKWHQNEKQQNYRRQSSSNHLQHECRIELIQNFHQIHEIYEVIIKKIYKKFYQENFHTTQNIEQILHEWLNRFRVQTYLDDSKNNLDKIYHLYYDVSICETKSSNDVDGDAHTHLNAINTDLIENDSFNERKYLLDENSHLLLKQLKQSQIEAKLVTIFVKTETISDRNVENYPGLMISPSKTFETDSYRTENPLRNDHYDRSHDHHQSHYHHNHHHNHDHRKKFHRRRNAYVDDENIYETPALRPDLILTTSSIDLNSIDSSGGGDQHNQHHAEQMTVLSRTLIPSMKSPIFKELSSSSLPSQSIDPTPKIDLSTITAKNVPDLNKLPMYPQLYGTPVLLPDLTLTKKMDFEMNQLNPEQPLLTPVFSTKSSIPTASIIVEEPVLITQSSSMTEIDDLKQNQTQSSNTSVQAIMSNTTTETTSTIAAIYHKPYVNKRISKLSITAGKYWQYTIPEDTFHDKEDGNTRQLRLGFFLDSEILPSDYWIQFDNENQYLYALPTDNDIGRHRFNLVAVNLQGGEATEIIEIYVRQSRHSLSFTHKFILANLTWDIDIYPERIQAISSILQRMSAQVFEIMPPVNALNEAILRQTILKQINVLSINQEPFSSKWSITWTNDSLRRHPCPINEINHLFSRLYDITYPENENGFMQPSQELRAALSPDFSIDHVKRIFIGRSACGSYAASHENTISRHKDKIVFSNRLNRIGPYRLGSGFKFLIPKDTIYSTTRQVDTRQLILSLAPLEPEIELPEFIHFDSHEQTIYGLPFKPEHVRTYELKLIAEDPINGGSEQDVFILDVAHDVNTREDYLFEITMSFLYRNIEMTSKSQQRLTSKDYYQIAQIISNNLMGNSNLDAFRMLEIKRNRFSKIADHISSLPFSDIDQNSKIPNKRQVYEQDEWSARIFSPRSRRQSGQLGDYFYEFIWTNRTLVTSYSHNAFGGGSMFETKTCPKTILQDDILRRLFPASPSEFLAMVNLEKNITNLDILDIYNQIFDPLEANLEFVSVEWSPKSVCYNSPGLETKIFGAKPIADTSAEDVDDINDENSDDDHETKQSESISETEDPSINIPVEDSTKIFDEYPNMIYYGDRLLAMLIPPVAILIALLFAVTIGCCFYRANQRRKAIGTIPAYHDESPSLYRQRIPIQLEFERGSALRSSGLHPNEQESMLDTKFGRQVQIISPKLRGTPGTNLSTATVLSSHQHPQQLRRHQNLPYQMLPQQ